MGKTTAKKSDEWDNKHCPNCRTKTLWFLEHYTNEEDREESLWTCDTCKCLVRLVKTI